APVNAPASGVLLDLGSLDRIASIDAASGIARVEAGCGIAALESAVRRAGCTLGPLLPSVRAGSVGAWLAGPTRGLRGIPGARRETAALTVAAVLADGRIAEGRAAPAKAVGPDLDHLALGGAGRLAPLRAACGRRVRDARAARGASGGRVRRARPGRRNAGDCAAPAARCRARMGIGGRGGAMAASARGARSRGVTALQRAHELC